MNKLVDSFGRKHTYLRISVTDRCNLRCLYCMPHEGMEFQPKKELLSFEEIFRLSRIFVSLGINKIRLTGGEPMVRRNLPVLVELLAGFRQGNRTIVMTTHQREMAAPIADWVLALHAGRVASFEPGSPATGLRRRGGEPGRPTL